MRGSNDAPVQTVSPIRLPAFAGGALTLDASLATLGEGTATIRLTSLSDATKTATVTALLRAVDVPTTTTISPTTTTSSTIAAATTSTTVSAPTTTSTLPPAATTTTTTPSSPTTTLPGDEEICGNCEDDDGNGLTDFDDPACCAGAPSALTLKKVRLTPQKKTPGTTRFQLAGTLPGTTTFDSAGQHVVLQLRAADGDELLCARLPAGTFVAKKKSFLWKDKAGVIASARGLRKTQLRLMKTGSAALTASGKQVRLQTPAPSSVEVTLAFQGTTPADAQARCLSTTAAFRAKGKKGALKFP